MCRVLVEKELLDKILTAEGWMFKAVGMQIVTEGLALYNFREMRKITREPLLKEMLTYVSRDEARHTAFGIRYLGRVVPTLSPEQRIELEDFAFEASRMLLDSRRGATPQHRRDLRLHGRSQRTVERAHQTLQDQLVKELRLNRIMTARPATRSSISFAKTTIAVLHVLLRIRATRIVRFSHRTTWFVRSLGRRNGA
jgi:hypothetical protein